MKPFSTINDAHFMDLYKKHAMSGQGRYDWTKALLVVELAVRSVIQKGGRFTTQDYGMRNPWAWWLFPTVPSPLMAHVEVEIRGDTVRWRARVELFWRLAMSVRIDGDKVWKDAEEVFETVEEAVAFAKKLLRKETRRWWAWARTHDAQERLSGRGARPIAGCQGITTINTYNEDWQGFLKYRGISGYEKWLDGQGEEA